MILQGLSVMRRACAGRPPRPFAGIPCQQQVLCFTGQHLKDHLTLDDHFMQEYTLSDEVG